MKIEEVSGLILVEHVWPTLQMSQRGEHSLGKWIEVGEWICTRKPWSILGNMVLLIRDIYQGFIQSFISLKVQDGARYSFEMKGNVSDSSVRSEEFMQS